MRYHIRPENGEFAVYDQGTDEFLGILSCPYEQTEADFEREAAEAGFDLVRRGEILNIDLFDHPDLKGWNFFAIDPGLDADDTGGDEGDG